MTPNPYRLYIITGKGGVGKTSIAMALTKKLETDGCKVLYNSFYQTPEKHLWEKLKLPVLDSDLYASAEIYIGRKLKSTTIASWIMKTHFFKSLFQMIPGLGHMILLGRIIDELEREPSLTIVLDSPASGHALTMFESSSNFKKIFQTGMIVNDIERMHRFLAKDHHLKTVIVGISTELAMTEATDLKEEIEIQTTGPQLNASIIVNDSYLQYIKNYQINEKDLPDFLLQKINLEKEVVGNFPVLPHCDQSEQDQVIKELVPMMGELI